MSSCSACPRQAARRGEATSGVLRAHAARFEQAFGGRVDVIVAEDVPVLAPPLVEALAGAVGEALGERGQAWGAAKVTVYVEPGDDEGCSVR